MALELAGADGLMARTSVHTERGAVNILAGEGRASIAVDHDVALVAGLASAVSDPERSVL